MLIADGFKLTGLEDKVAARCAGAKTVTETTGAGKLRSNTGSQAKFMETDRRGNRVDNDHGLQVHGHKRQCDAAEQGGAHGT